jgi:type I restriction enzyme R subunit
MEIFGTRPDPSRKPAPDNVPEPFHVYSMRQAIEEGFILDVLQNYTTYSVAFKLAHAGEEIDNTEVERSAALKRIMGWVKLHPYNISQKVQVVVEHFREFVAALLDGRAKAMVVVGSRVEGGALAARHSAIRRRTRLRYRHTRGFFWVTSTTRSRVPTHLAKPVAL